MKRSIKIFLIIIGCIIGPVIIFFAVFLIRTNLETGKMVLLETQEVIKGIFAVKDVYVNVYLIKRGENYIAIDAGSDKKTVTLELNRLNINVDRVSSLFLTHSDFDHTGGIELFKNAQIYLPEAEEQMINGKNVRLLFFFKNKLNREYKLIKDGEVIDIEGFSIRCIATPGHTPGSVCYLVDGRYLFAGDNFSLKDGKAGLFNDFFNMDSRTQKKSLFRLKELKGVEYIFTGHYGFSADFDKAFKDFN
jgi:hydroxyacylglutathione hydrolase